MRMSLDLALSWLRGEMNDLDAGPSLTPKNVYRYSSAFYKSKPNEYRIGGSAAMYLQGIDVVPGDIDFYVTRRVWNGLVDRGWEPMIIDRRDPPLARFEFFDITLDCWYDWRNRFPYDDIIRAGFANLDWQFRTVRGLSVFPLSQILIWKEAWRREKDLKHAKMIREKLGMPPEFNPAHSNAYATAVVKQVEMLRSLGRTDVSV